MRTKTLRNFLNGEWKTRKKERKILLKIILRKIFEEIVISGKFCVFGKSFSYSN